MHGGKGGRPIEHGRYSQHLAKVADDLREKIEFHKSRPDPDEIAEEMAILRALRDEHLEKHGDLRIVLDKDGEEVEIEIDSTRAINTLAETIRKSAASRTQMRNSSALTEAEITLIQTRIADVVLKYVPESERAKCARDLRSLGGLLPEPVAVNSA